MPVRTRMTGQLLLLLVASCGVVCGSELPARAQASGNTPDREAERRRLYAQGVALADEGRWTEALLSFETVVAIRSAPPALLALGMAREKTGRLLRAREAYNLAATGARAAHDADLTAKAERAASELQRQIPRIIVLLPEEAVEARVTIDGVVTVAGDPGQEVDPGNRRVVVLARNGRIFDKVVNVTAGARHEVLVQLSQGTAPTQQVAPARPTRSIDSPAPPPAPRPFPAEAVVLGTAGVIATTAGLIVRFAAQSTYDDAAVACPEPTSCADAAAAERGNDARSRMLLGTVVAGVGAGAFAGGVLWFMLRTGPSKTHEETRGLSLRVSSIAGGGLVAATAKF